MCADLGMPIICHGADQLYNHPYEFEEMARTFPEVTVIMAHMGTMWACEQARIVAQRYKNIMLDTAAAFPGDIALAVRETGADKVIMGSDGPIGFGADNTSVEIQKVKAAVPDEKERALVLGNNVARILKIL